LTDGVETKLSTKNLIKPNPLFKNPAITEQVFNKSHPYFNVDAKYKAFAKTNFGFNIPTLPTKTNPITNPITNKDIVKNEAEKFTGTKLNKTAFKFVNDDLKVVKGDGFINPKCTQISFGLDEDPIKWKEKTVYHELGHITHIQTKQIYYNGYKLAYSEDFEQYLSLAKKELKIVGTRDVINGAIKDVVLNPNIKEEVSAFLDTIGDLSKGIKGRKLGHDQVYYKRMHGMETFAHLNENYFQGNEIFKKYMPKSYEAGINYLKKIYGE
jgi:hypothetical protein